MAVATIAVSGLGTGAAAQPVIATAEECAQRTGASAELACLREALAASRAALAAVNQPAAIPNTRATAPGRAAQAQPAPAQPQTGAPQPVQSVVQPPVAGSVATKAPRPAMAELGAEQLVRDDTDPSASARAERPSETVEAIVTAYVTDGSGLLVMRLDNGQIWRQEEQETVPLRLAENEQPSVEIQRSGFGGYRMRFPEQNRRIRVLRLK